MHQKQGVKGSMPSWARYMTEVFVSWGEGGL